MDTLQEQLDPGTLALLRRYHFDPACFEAHRARLSSGCAEESDNHVVGTLEPPLPGEVRQLAALGSTDRGRLHAAGMAALSAGRVAMCILAGGMATRFGGVVKAEVEVFEGLSFLQLKLRDAARLAEQLQTQLRVVLMTSFATDARIRALIASEPPGPLRIDTFPQSVSLRLTPTGTLFRDASGRPSPYAPGHGDLVPALRRAGLLHSLRSAGVACLFVSNVDNLAATLEPAVIGAHLATQVAMTFEVAGLCPGDRGGVPARLDGRLQVIEALRYPPGFVESDIPWLSTNTFMLELAQLDTDFALDWFRVGKLVEGRPAVQFERFVNQLTAFLPARALAIDREGADCRFLPVKDPAELRTRLPLIEAVLRERGIL
jgi:UTP--glucose-1-phosphate uridylyltransferase